MATVLTLTRVPKDDPVFAEPTKPIGPYYDEQEAPRLMKERGWAMAPAPGERNRWRRVVPSPHPHSIVEAPVIRRLVADGVIVIAAGSGGVPVVEEGPRLVGVEGVVDKDLAACILARDVEAGEFGEGSMKPKVEAAVRFVTDPGKRAIIASLQHAGPALAGKAGTQIVA